MRKRGLASFFMKFIKEKFQDTTDCLMVVLMLK